MPNPLTAPAGTPATPANLNLNIPIIPTATDLPSALVALNTVGQAVAQIAAVLAALQTSNSTTASGNTNNSNNNSFTSGVSLSTLADYVKKSDLAGATFTVTQQTVSPVTVTDPNDPSVSTTYNQVTSLTLKSSLGETWVWTI